ncbi:hypothetical protein WJX73_007438 [Symbiochloris irregularis]|uniref:Bacteriophage/plasmid primase P4 C-terminal domain-containing protein n=1 Tax=Symbiochloris irregularis TaxID=706552 RepID=A0AAW1NW29_9CHLO
MAAYKRKGRADNSFQKRARNAVKHLRKAQLRVDKLSSLRAIVEAGKALWRHKDFRDVLDSDPDTVGCAGHVIDLRTGGLRPGRPEDFISRQLGCDYGGIALPTSDVDKLMFQLFGNDMATVKYVQILLGYGLTAHTTHNLLVLGYGSGGNGKGWLLTLIRELLGPYYCAMSKDCVVKAGKASAKGAHTDYIAKLMARRMGGFDFRPTHLPIVMTNHLPRISSVTNAIRRRVRVLPFEASFKEAHEYDEANPAHRLYNRENMTWLASESSKQQFLTWLVHGAIRWYNDGRTLGALPAKLQTALDDYLGGPHTDALLSQFIQECCIQEIEAKESKRSMYAAFVAFAKGFGASVQYDEFNSTMRRLRPHFVPDKRTRLP